MKRPAPIALIMSLLLLVLFSSLHMGVNAQDDSTPRPRVPRTQADDTAATPTEADMDSDRTPRSREPRTTADEPSRYDQPALVLRGDAEWTLNETRFISQYPDGFVFEGNASSSAGDIASVNIIFSHNEEFPFDLQLEGVFDAAKGDMRVDVVGEDADNIPAWVPVNYRWRITDTAGSIFYSEWIVGAEYTDITSEWTLMMADDYPVYVQAGLPFNIAELVTKRLRDNIPIMTEHFGESLRYNPRIILYANRDAFDAWRTTDADPAGDGFVVGTTNDAWGATVQFYSEENPEALANVVVHEFVHLYQSQVWRIPAPGWFVEGQATYFEFLNEYDIRTLVSVYAARNEIPRVFADGQVLGVGQTWSDGRGRLWYDLGSTFFAYLVTRYGVDAHREINQRMGDPDLNPNNAATDLAAIIEDVTGTDLETIQTFWRRWIGASGTAPTIAPTPTTYYEVRPTQTPFGN